MKKYVVLDLEMCVVPRSSRKQFHRGREIIQIGAVLLDENYKTLDEFMTFVKPQYGGIDSFIKKLTGINQLDVKEAPCFENAIVDFLDWIPDEDVTMVSWSETDKLQIHHEKQFYEIESEKLEMLLENWVDCQKLYGDRLEYDNPRSLQEALIVADLDIEGREHDGLCDAINTAALFAKLSSEEQLVLNIDYMKAFSGKREELTYSLGDLIAGLAVG